MDRLKVCFAGVGSIATRHIRNLRRICGERGIDVKIDAYRRTYRMTEGVEAVYCNVDEMPDDYDVIFITNPTEQHLNTLKILHDKGKQFFIEKPVVSLSQIEEAKRFARRSDTVYYVACPVRYNAVIQYIREYINSEDVVSVRIISSSFLPDWRPGTDYRESYSAHKDMGGGVSIDLIHEWDYMCFLFGEPTKVKSMIGKKSSLEIDSDDYALYIAEYQNMIAEIHLDYFGRKTIREIMLFTKDDTILGDIANNRITWLKSGKMIDFHEERDDYQRRELSHFLDIIDMKVENDAGFDHGLRMMELSQGRTM